MTAPSKPANRLWRRATTTDAVTVRDITRAAYAKWVPLIGREPKPMTADYAAAVAAHIIDLLIEGENVIGLVEVVPERACLLIENIAVLPERHGQGIGSVLLERATVIAHSLGLAELRLYTNVRFDSNIAFYARRGFVEYQREPFPGGSIAVHMRKSIGA